MTDAVETMAYAGETPWHGLGNSVSDKLTPKQMIKAANLGWTVSKVPMFLKSGAEVPDKFALVRDTDEQVLSVVGSNYKPVQNEEAFDFFKRFVTAGHMKMETAGSLWDGRYVWALARINADFALNKKDEMRNYLLLASPHVHGKSLVIKYTPIRVVCWNTLSMALRSGAQSFRMTHNKQFDATVKQEAEQTLGIAKEEIDNFKQAVTLLAKKKAKADAVEDYFCEVLRYDPKSAKKKKSDDPREPRALPKFRQALEHAPGQELPSAAGTWWGALNAVTYVVDHEIGRNRSTALRNAWLGNMANVKQRAFKLALDNAS